MSTIGLWQINDQGPARLHAGELELERHLENWIERDPSLLERGLVIVGRQVRLEGGPLDLLALDPQGRWVLIEIKRDQLRREVIAQAIDYASCLHGLGNDALRAQCDAYLRGAGAGVTLDGLLEQRGRSLKDETEGRDIIIYLVGTGLDPGLERMVGFLAERADLAVRMVTYAVFNDAAGRPLLAREIHESEAETAQVVLRASSPAMDLSDVLRLAEQNGLIDIARTLIDAAQELGLPARPFPRGIMFTPPSNRTRCLVWLRLDRRREAGVARVYVNAEAFEQFYGIKNSDVVAAVGPSEYVPLDKAGALCLAAGLRTLLGQKGAE